MPKIKFKNVDKTFEVQKGTSVLEAALQNKVPIYHTCGGNCSCSTCRIRVIQGAESLSSMEKSEMDVLDVFDLKPPHRLGCQSLIFGEYVEVEVPERDKEPRPNKTPNLPDN